MDAIIIHQKPKKGKLDSFFYDGDIATFKHPLTKIEYCLSAGGDIEVNLKFKNGNEDTITTRNIDEKTKHYRITDKTLKKWNNENIANWQMNNWFSTTWIEDELIQEASDVEYNYDDALSSFKQVILDQTPKYARQLIQKLLNNKKITKKDEIALAAMKL